MAGYVLLSWTAGHSLAEARIALVRDALVQRSGWRIDEAAPGLLLLVDPARPPQVRRLAWRAGRIIGDLFGRRDHGPAPLLLPRPDHLAAGDEALCAHMTEAYWGRYVVIAPSVAVGGGFVFRGPPGAPEAFFWRRDGITIVCSSLVDWLLRLLAPPLGLDHAAIAQCLLDPANLCVRLGLDGVRGLAPGAMSDLAGRNAARAIWRPQTYARRSSADGARADPTGLVRTIDACAGALAGAHGRVLAEVSGGLDSSVMASALQAAGRADVSWVHFHVADPEGDERAYVRALAERLDIVVSEVAKTETAFTEARLTHLPLDARPSVNGLDGAYDDAMAARCRDLGADAIFTGQGGDAIFHQMGGPLIAADLFERGAGPRARRLIDLACWNRTSVWSLLIAAARSRLRRSASPRPRPAFISRTVTQASPGAAHPWLCGLEAITPAKRLQIHGLAHTLLTFGASRRGQAAELIHPLLSQPVIEHCLGVATIELTDARRDRAMVRSAFAGRLPAAITERRSKGDLTAYYGRMLARSVPVLRAFLMEGWLAQHGFVDTAVLSERLNEDDLIVSGGYPELMELIAVEAWARGWDSLIRNLPDCG
jgi:asparagine synthase (glutamine-hydrolysing)